MAIISMDDLRPGMTLATDLRTKQGRLLLPAGTSLTLEHIKIARTWGVAEATVCPRSLNVSPGNILANLGPDAQDALKALIDWKFAWCDPDLPITRKLVALFQRRIVSEMAVCDTAELLRKYRGPKFLDAPPALREGDCRPKMEHIVSGEVELVTLPDIFHQLLEVAQRPTSSSAQIAEIISKDTSLSSRLLRLVNSSYFGFISKVDTLTRAVTIIGTVEVTNLAIGISITSMFKDIPKDIIEMRDFWEHSIAVGTLARMLAAQMNETGLERMFVGGLLHDVGRLVLIKNHPATTAKILQLSCSSPHSLVEIEERTLGFTHAMLGGALLKAWNIPENLQATVRDHHPSVRDAGFRSTHLIHIADIIAHAIGFGHSGSRRVPPIAEAVWKDTGLSLNVLPTVITQAQNQLRDLMRVIVQEKSDAA